MRRGAVRTGAWALGDQILSSATNFAAGIVVARIMGPSGYGSFTLAFGTWVILLGTTRAMLVQPYTVAAAGASPDAWREATRATAAAVLAFGGAFGVISVGAGALLGIRTPTGSAFLALGIFAAPLALQDFWRFAAFSRNEPRAAALNDGMWAIVQAGVLAALLMTRALTPGTAVGAWGLGALAGALYGLRQFGTRPAHGVRERQFIRENASLAGWFGASNASYQLGAYGATLIIGSGAGPAALGGLSSAANLLSPFRILVSSGESLTLPAVARAARAESRDRFRRLCTIYSLGFASLFVLAGSVLVPAGPSVLRLLFGSRYVRYAALIAPTVVATFISELAAGLILGFRALGEGRRLATLQVVSTIMRLVFAAAALPFGLLAIAWGLAASEGIRTIIAWVMFENAVARAWQAREPARVERAPRLAAIACPAPQVE